MPWLLLLILTLFGSTGHAQELTLWHAYRGAERTTLEALLETYSAETDGVTVRARAIPTMDSIPSSRRAVLEDTVPISSSLHTSGLAAGYSRG